MTPHEKRKVLFDWGIADYFGWGVYGFNLLYHGQMRQDLEVIPLSKPSYLYPLDPLTKRFLEPATNRSGQLKVGVNDHFLVGGGNQVPQRKHEKLPTSLVTFFERNPLGPDDLERMRSYDRIVTGSTWNTNVLEGHGLKPIKVIQGIDTENFRPLPKRYFKDRFVVFSGGKLEHRKGQDLLVKAFSIFASTHPDALLIAAWRSPWEKNLNASINTAEVCLPYQPQEDVGQSIREWLSKNGLKEEQYLVLEATPNRLMPDVFREVDLAIFPNRCEGGTNLVAMEALCSGVTCALSVNTGHLDLVGPENCIPLSHQGRVNAPDTVDWGESSVEEILAALQSTYDGKRVNVERARDSVVDFTWSRAIHQLLDAL